MLSLLVIYVHVSLHPLLTYVNYFAGRLLVPALANWCQHLIYDVVSYDPTLPSIFCTCMCWAFTLCQIGIVHLHVDTSTLLASMLFCSAFYSMPYLVYWLFVCVHTNSLRF